jgi:hypothetical protein
MSFYVLEAWNLVSATVTQSYIAIVVFTEFVVTIFTKEAPMQLLHPTLLSLVRSLLV